MNNLKNPSTQLEPPKNSTIQNFTMAGINYFVQTMFSTLLFSFLTNYYFKYLNLTQYEVILVPLIGYFPLLLKPFVGLIFTRKNTRQFNYKPWLIISGLFFPGCIALLALVESSAQLFLHVLFLFGANLSLIVFDTVNDTIILTFHPQRNSFFSMLQQVTSTLGSFAIVLLFTFFIGNDYEGGNWVLLFVFIAIISTFPVFSALFYTRKYYSSELNKSVLEIQEKNSSPPSSTSPPSSHQKIHLSSNMKLFLIFLFCFNVSYLVDFSLEKLLTANFGNSAVTQMVMAQSISRVIGIVTSLLLLFFQTQFLKYRKLIFIISGLYGIIYVAITPYAPLSILLVLTYGYSPFSMFMMISITSMMISFAPKGQKGLWYQIFAGVFVLSRFIFTVLGTLITAIWNIQDDNPILFIISALLILINLPLLLLIKIPQISEEIDDLNKKINDIG